MFFQCIISEQTSTREITPQQGNDIHKVRKDNIQENFKVLYNEMNKSAKSEKVLGTRSVLCTSIFDASFSKAQKSTLFEFNNLLIKENRKLSNHEKEVLAKEMNKTPVQIQIFLQKLRHKVKMFSKPVYMGR